VLFGAEAWLMETRGIASDVTVITAR